MHKATRYTLIAAGTLVASAAIALPWDVDMADSDAVKAYEQTMRPLPDGVVSQPNLLTPRSFSSNYDRGTNEGKALLNPHASTEDSIAGGKKMFDIYCTPCHGDGVVNGPVGDPDANRFPNVPALAGKGGRLSGYTDGYVYLTIRNGGGLMPYYGWAMTDEEMWSIVSYVRTMPDSAYIPPAPEPEPVPEGAEGAEGVEASP